MIILKNISKIYKMHENTVTPLKNISINIKKNEFVSIIGTSGSGKTTLMNILGTLDQSSVGDYYLNNIHINNIPKKHLALIRNEQIGFIFQSFNLLPKLSALENVELPLIFAGIPKNKRKILSEIALEKVGLSHRLYHTPSQMSGGQQQRVAIARAIAMSPPIILADEPTGNLDPTSSCEILEILTNLHLDGRLIVLITHDIAVSKQANRIITLSNGEISSDIANL